MFDWKMRNKTQRVSVVSCLIRVHLHKKCQSDEVKSLLVINFDDYLQLELWCEVFGVLVVLILQFNVSHVCPSVSVCVVSSQQSEGAGPGSGQRSTWSPGGGGAASAGGGAERGGAGGAVSPHTESSLEPGSVQSDPNTLAARAHADTRSGRTAGGERWGVEEHVLSWNPVNVCKWLKYKTTDFLSLFSDKCAGHRWKVILDPWHYF